MTKVLILVEGQTEETFVRELLAPHLLQNKVIAISTLASTKRVKKGPIFKGGIVSYGKVRSDLFRLLHDSSAAMVTTLIDFYGLPLDFPGLKTMPTTSCYDKIAHLEKAFQEEINNGRFVPYFSLHEFEGMMFTSPEEIAKAFPGTSRGKLAGLKEIRSNFDTPEEINDGQLTAPSKRLKALFPEYQKTLHGPLVMLGIGIDSIRQECTHFDGWLTNLEALSSPKSR